MPYLERLTAAKISRLSEGRPFIVQKPDNIRSEKVSVQNLEIGLLFGIPLLLFLLLRFFKIPRNNGRGEEDENAAALGKATPCASCRFFSNNVYLKCAVRPSDALTDRAVDCPDYRPRDR
ncbi:hypothetical protein V0288_04905 [Pannus brasiliensis CCIBt3594]|uniref:Uncharacterized protein n=1 Tax=Pannus brasiliensis CCIBt3594 TaxID=1427578 RepID=A0AAW9QMR3_9CHRO